jgi:hypothetical protein
MNSWTRPQPRHFHSSRKKRKKKRQHHFDRQVAFYHNHNFQYLLLRNSFTSYKNKKRKKLQNEKGDLYRVTKNQSREGSAGLVRLHGNVSILRGNVCFDKKEMTNAYILSGSGQRKTSHAGHAFKFGKNRPTGRLKFRVGKKGAARGMHGRGF